MKNMENTIKTVRNLTANLMNTKIRLVYSHEENFSGKIEIFRPDHRKGLQTAGYTTDKRGRKNPFVYMATQEISIFVPVTKEKNCAYWHNKVFA